MICHPIRRPLICTGSAGATSVDVTMADIAASVGIYLGTCVVRVPFSKIPPPKDGPLIETPNRTPRPPKHTLRPSTTTPNRRPLGGGAPLLAHPHAGKREGVVLRQIRAPHREADAGGVAVHGHCAYSYFVLDWLALCVVSFGGRRFWGLLTFS